MKKYNLFISNFPWIIDRAKSNCVNKCQASIFVNYHKTFRKGDKILSIWGREKMLDQPEAAMTAEEHFLENAICHK